MTYKKKRLTLGNFVGRRTGDIRPLTGPLRRGDRQMMGLGAVVRQRRTPPKGIMINHNDLTLLASAPPQAENCCIQGLEKEVLEVKCRVGKHNNNFLKQNINDSKNTIKVFKIAFVISDT